MKQRVLSQAARYLQQYKNILIEYRITDLESGIDRLKEGSTNLLITERSKIGKEFDSKLLKPERYILVGPYSWKNRKVDDIIANERIIDFDPSDTMTYCFLEKYDLLETSNRERYFVNITEYISDFVISGVGFSVLSKEMAEPLIADKKLVDLCPGKFYDYEIALAWYPRKHMSRSFKDLIAGIK